MQLMKMKLRACSKYHDVQLYQKLYKFMGIFLKDMKHLSAVVSLDFASKK